jgi:threonine synthase
MTALRVDDEETATAIRRVYDENGYVMDPHGAVGYHALTKYTENRPDLSGIFLATAHPLKFDAVAEILGNYGAIQDLGAGLQAQQKIEMDVDYSQLRDILVSKL